MFTSEKSLYFCETKDTMSSNTHRRQTPNVTRHDSIDIYIHLPNSSWIQNGHFEVLDGPLKVSDWVNPVVKVKENQQPVSTLTIQNLLDHFATGQRHFVLRNNQID